ncbi:MAG: hypothetical protein IJU64_06845 [Bacilli bacterium]|nr:hypothetical protein [Bacilli bacterium]
MRSRSVADRYLAAYQKLCLTPFFYALISVVSTTILLGTQSVYSLPLAFYLVRILHDIGWELIWVMVLGIGIALVFLLTSAYAAKGKWWLLFIPLAFVIADFVLGIVFFAKLDAVSFYFGLAMHIIALVAFGFVFFFAHKTIVALKEEKKA